MMELAQQVFMLALVALGAVSIPVLVIEEGKQLPRRVKSLRLYWENRPSLRRKVMKGW